MRVCVPQAPSSPGASCAPAYRPRQACPGKVRPRFPMLTITICKQQGCYVSVGPLLNGLNTFVDPAGSRHSIDPRRPFQRPHVCTGSQKYAQGPWRAATRDSGRPGEARNRAVSLEEERSGLDRKLEALIEKIESKRRQLELVEATEEQLAAQERDQRVQGEGPGASTQVRG
jgi:hypothetical protein